MFTDGQTDRRTDDGRRAIVLAHGLVGAYARGPAFSWVHCLGSAMVGRRINDRKIAGSTPGPGRCIAG